MKRPLQGFLLISLALVLTWAAGQVTGPAADTEAETEAETETETGEPAPAGDAAPVVQDMTAEEIEAEIREMERALGEAPRPGPGEVAADKPLPADLGVAFPSDM